MSRFLTCHTCALPAPTCPKREAVQAAIVGLGITSLRHRCPDYRAAFVPGEAVKAETLAWYHRDDDDPPPRLWFPGHFIQMVGQRALVFVPAGAVDLCGQEVAFEPSGRGYLKLPIGRVAHRDGEPANVEACRWCAAIPAIGDPCGRDPNYTPAGDCLADARPKASTATGAEVSPGPNPNLPNSLPEQGD